MGELAGYLSDVNSDIFMEDVVALPFSAPVITQAVSNLRIFQGKSQEARGAAGERVSRVHGEMGERGAFMDKTDIVVRLQSTQIRR